MNLFLNFKYGRERMTFPATNVRIETGPPGLFAESGDLYPALEPGCQRTTHLAE
jgi:hypothetical protein